MPAVGDRVGVRSVRIGQAEREGVVTQVLGHLLRVQWSTGEESTFTPGPGSLTVVGRTRVVSKKAPSKKAPSKKAPSKKKAAAASTKKRATTGNKKTAKKSVTKKNAAPRKTR
jgi:hypothetical protein